MSRVTHHPWQRTPWTLADRALGSNLLLPVLARDPTVVPAPDCSGKLTVNCHGTRMDFEVRIDCPMAAMSPESRRATFMEYRYYYYTHTSKNLEWQRLLQLAQQQRKK